MLVLTLNRGERLLFETADGKLLGYVSLNRKLKKSPKSVSLAFELPEDVKVTRQPIPEEKEG